MSELIDQLDYLVSDIITLSTDGSLTRFDYIDNLTKIIAICQPKWIPVSDRLPDEEPHRNVEIAYLDAAGHKYSGQVSSRFVSNGQMNCYAWREIEPLPEPPNEGME